MKSVEYQFWKWFSAWTQTTEPSVYCFPLQYGCSLSSTLIQRPTQHYWNVICKVAAFFPTLKINQKKHQKMLDFVRFVWYFLPKQKKIETFKPKILDIFKVEPLAPSSRCLCLLIDIETYFHMIPHPMLRLV